MTDELYVDIIGWIGSILLIAAYLLISQDRIKSQSYTYQLLNVVGSVLLIVNTIYYRAYPSSALNVIWVVIGIVYIAKISQKPQNQQ
ncbi:MAG: hypothetical protein RIG77_10450 [Cyclobacteriaceae bacterium]